MNKRSSSRQPDIRGWKHASTFSVIQKCSYFAHVKTRVPVHLRLVSSLFEALRSLQSKFSSQNSANHTFLRLFSRVSAVKYSSNPANSGKRRMAQFRTNYQPIETGRKLSKTCAVVVVVVVVWWPLGVGNTPASTTSSKFDHGGSSSSQAPWNFNNFFHLGNYIN